MQRLIGGRKRVGPPRLRTRSGRETRARFHGPANRAARRGSRLPKLAIALAVLVIVGAVGAFKVQSFLDGLPSIDGLNSANFSGDTRIYDRGSTLLADLGDEGSHRVNVTLDQVSPKLVQGTVAIEDKSFWTNSGFDPGGIVRSGVSDIRAGEVVGGGSTITQQLVKQQFLSSSETYQRKAKEVVLAYRLTQKYSKQQILELYLNKSNYGELQYGVQAASRTYFHKDAKDLDLAQSALLAGLPQAPAAWDPIQHPDLAKARQQQVLNAMVEARYITQTDAQTAAAEQLQVFPPVSSTYQAPHFVSYVRNELAELGFQPGQQQLVVKTSLDWNKQQLAQQAVTQNLQRNAYRDPGGLLSSSTVSLDPKTGQILTYVGSPNYNGEAGQYDFVSGKPVNPGSSLKPFTYAAAIANRQLTMDTPIDDGPSPYKLPQAGSSQPYTVFDYDKKAHGKQPARVALASSLNIPAVKVEMAVGVPSMVDFWRKLGLHPRDGTGNVNAPLSAYGPSTTLGGAPVTLLSEAAAYATLATLGTYHPPEAILQVTDTKGRVLYQADPNKDARQVLDPGVAFIVGQMISDDGNRVPPMFPKNSALNLAGHRVAAKSGTTDNFKDALTAGFTPDLASVFWVGDIKGSNSTLTGGSDGVFVAGPGWNQYMSGALKGVPDRWFTPPADVQRGAGNSWFLQDATSIAQLPGDTAASPSPSAQPSPGTTGVPANPAAAPVPVGGNDNQPQGNEPNPAPSSGGNQPPGRNRNNPLFGEALPSPASSP
ncbi:MAG TPA: transglycosylase domain-containing protein [Candidatus Binatia bacterium]|nr:transglycosylase domain-containing protein [Candidatus Binatia bacterium]